MINLFLMLPVQGNVLTVSCQLKLHYTECSNTLSDTESYWASLHSFAHLNFSVGLIQSENWCFGARSANTVCELTVSPPKVKTSKSKFRFVPSSVQ